MSVIFSQRPKTVGVDYSRIELVFKHVQLSDETESIMIFSAELNLL